MSTIRKHRKKWQVLIRRRDHPQISKCFLSKEAAREWARETEVNIEKGLYANLTEAHKLLWENCWNSIEIMFHQGRKDTILNVIESISCADITSAAQRYLNLRS